MVSIRYVAIGILFLIVGASFLPIYKGTNGVSVNTKNPQITEGFNPEYSVSG